MSCFGQKAVALLSARTLHEPRRFFPAQRPQEAVFKGFAAQDAMISFLKCCKFSENFENMFCVTLFAEETIDYEPVNWMEWVLSMFVWEYQPPSWAVFYGLAGHNTMKFFSCCSKFFEDFNKVCLKCYFFNAAEKSVNYEPLELNTTAAQDVRLGVPTTRLGCFLGLGGSKCH